MNKKSAMMSLVLLPMMSMAQSVTSPNGNVEVKFSLTGNGQPTYEMSYKGKTVNISIAVLRKCAVANNTSLFYKFSNVPFAGD